MANLVAETHEGSSGHLARSLYRFYLYTVFIAMLIFATFGLARLLVVLLGQTSLRGAAGVIPSSADIVRAVVFAVIAWAIAGLVGGLHYWLIQRDIRTDPDAGSGAVRAFYFNIVELIAAPLAVTVGAFGVIQQLGTMSAGDLSGSAAFTIATLALVGFLEWERRRAPAGAGVASVFQRLHLYGVQLILLFVLAPTWLDTIRMVVDDLVFGGAGAMAAGGPGLCGGFTTCQWPNVLSRAAAMLWIAAFWAGYGFLAWRDTHSLLRQILYFASFAGGVGFTLWGAALGVELLLVVLLGIKVSARDVAGPGAIYNFVPLLTLGLLVMGIYLLWLNVSQEHRLMGRVSTALTTQAIATALLAMAFWWGIGLVLLHALESISGVSTSPDTRAWAGASAFVITGLGYIPWDWYLHQRRTDPAAAGPRRGFVFALLGGGILAGAIGAVVALYALATSLLGSPLSNWPDMARMGTAALVVGIVIAGIYFRVAIHERLFSGLTSHLMPGAPMRPVPTSAETPPAPVAGSIEAVLDELLAGKISRDEAAARIRALNTRSMR
jgi:hypothetical protein